MEDVNKTTVSDISARTVTRMSLATVVTSVGMKIIRISGKNKVPNGQAKPPAVHPSRQV